MPAIRRLAHLCFKTDQLDRMTAFYRDVLGLPVQFTFEDKDGKTFGAYFDAGDNTFVEIFDQRGSAAQWGGEVVAMRGEDGTRYQHFCFEIEDLAGYRATLVARGLAVTEIRVGMDGSKQAWLRDPDGNNVELMEYTSASLQLRPAGGVAR